MVLATFVTPVVYADTNITCPNGDIVTIASNTSSDAAAKACDGHGTEDPSFAQNGAGCESSSNFLSFPTWYKYLPQESVAGKCSPVMNELGDAIPILVAVVEILLRIVGLASVGYVIYGSIRYILSQGQPEATKNARQTIINAIIGVAISIIAAGAVSFFASRLTGADDQAFMRTRQNVKIERYLI